MQHWCYLTRRAGKEATCWESLVYNWYHFILVVHSAGVFAGVRSKQEWRNLRGRLFQSMDIYTTQVVFQKISKSAAKYRLVKR